MNTKIKKKIILLILVITFIFTCCFPVILTSNAETKNETNQNSEQKTNKSSNSSASTNTTPNIASKSAILIDNSTNKTLYEKNSTQKMAPASTTKIVTAILTLENCNLDDKVTASYNSIMSIPVGYSTADIQIGEILTVEQLLQMLLLHSANDAANILAEHVGGSIESFVSMMNTKVHELGLSNTNFTNAYGMDDANHYTTAYDLSQIMKYCIKNDDFRRISGSASCAIPATNMHDSRLYSSTNELIDPSNKNYYKYLTAGKTGFTTNAGDCLVSSAYKNDLEFICVILGGKEINGISTRFSESKLLYEYGYNSYSIHTIVNSNDIVYQLSIDNATPETKNLNLLASSSISDLLSNNTDTTSYVPEITLNSDISAPISEGQILGYATYTIDGKNYKTDLVASHNVISNQLPYLVLLISIIIIALISIIFYIYYKRRVKNQQL